MKFVLIAFIAVLGFKANTQKIYSEEAAEQTANNLLKNNGRQYGANNAGFDGNNRYNNRWTVNSNILKGSNEITLGNQNQINT